MKTVYTQEELEMLLTDLRGKRDKVYNRRKSVLERYSRKKTVANVKAESETNINLHELDRQIEDLERKLENMF